MEEEIGRNLPSLSPDQVEMPGCGSELARTNSDSSTLSTIDGSKDSSQPHDAGFCPGTSTVWTDKKHSLYIESLETSFISQLHHSIELRDCLHQTTRGPPYWELSANGGSNSHQLMLLEDGCWQNVNSARKEPLLESTADSHSIQFNPWVHRFESSGRQHNPASHYLGAKNASCSKKNCSRSSTMFCEIPKSFKSSEKDPECCQNLADHKREASDQNFVNGGQGDGPSCFRASKRLCLLIQGMVQLAVELSLGIKKQALELRTENLNNLSLSLSLSLQSLWPVLFLLL